MNREANLVVSRTVTYQIQEQTSPLVLFQDVPKAMSRLDTGIRLLNAMRKLFVEKYGTKTYRRYRLVKRVEKVLDL